LRTYKKWACPFCDQTSSRHWNLKTHIERNHNGAGDPVKAEEGYYPKKSSASYPRHEWRNTNIPSFSSKTANSDPLDIILTTLRKQVEYYELIRNLPPRQDLTTDNLLPLLMLVSFSNSFQKNNSRRSDELPIGYRIRFCNTCVSGNSMEPVFGSSIELEALTKTKHICERETAWSLTFQQQLKDDPNIMREGQEKLLCHLKQVVNIRIAGQQGRTGIQATLEAHEFPGLDFLLGHKGDKKLPDNKSWIEEKDYIDLDKISRSTDNSIEKQNHWIYRLTMKEGFTKMIKINEMEILEFVNISKATFGPFQIQINDETKRYFVISIKL